MKVIFFKSIQDLFHTQAPQPFPQTSNCLPEFVDIGTAVLSVCGASILCHKSVKASFSRNHHLKNDRCRTKQIIQPVRNVRFPNVGPFILYPEWPVGVETSPDGEHLVFEVTLRGLCPPPHPTKSAASVISTLLKV